MTPLYQQPPDGARKLRPYQQQAIDATIRQLAQYGSTVVVLPTGMGKTVYASKLIAGWEQGNTLFLAHTRELIHQAADKLGGELGYRPPIEMGVSAVELDTMYQGGMCVVASVQTMYGDKRLEKYRRHPFGLIVVDECVTGDTLIDTDAGKMRIDALPTSTARRVMTYDGEAVCYRPITAFMPKGVRPVLRIETASGRVIRCTGNHPLYTARGWVNASAVRKSDSLLRVRVGAASQRASTGGADRSSTSPVTSRSPNGHAASGSECTRSCSRTRHTVSAGAASGSNFGPDHSTASSTFTRAVGRTLALPTGTISDPQSGHTNSRLKSGKRFSARCSAIAASAIRTNGATTPVCTSTTAALSASGPRTRPHSFLNWLRARESTRATATAQSRCRSTPDACRASSPFTTSRTATGGSDSVGNGSTPSAKSGWRGGSVTTVRRPATVSSSTPKATRRKTFGSLPNGSATPTGRRASIATANDTTSSRRSRPLDAPSFAPSSDTCPTACSTSFDPVVSIRSDGAEPVYDISVEGTHCFFGNGVLVHNCHHATAATYRKVIDYFRDLNPSLKVVGITATPNRADGAALGIVFDSEAFQMTIGDAIGDGWLVPIEQEYIVCEAINYDGIKTKKNEFGEADFNGAALEDVMKEEEAVHAVAKPLVEKTGDRPTLVFCAGVEHAHLMAAVLNRYKPDSAVAVDGKTDALARKKAVADFASGRLQFLTNCNVFTEGFDAPNCSCVAMARPTKSQSLYMQMLGRGLRPLPNTVDGVPEAFDRRMSILTSGKPACYVMDFVGNSNHKLANVFDVLGGNYDVQVRDLAKQEAARQKKPVSEVLEQAKALLDLERQWTERRHVLANASYSAFGVNPFGDDAAPSVQTASATRGGSSDAQIGLLVKLGVDYATAAAYTKRQAGSVIDSMSSTRCTTGQAKTLRKHGIDPAGIGMDRASRIIDAIAQNGWKRPEELPA